MEKLPVSILVVEDNEDNRLYFSFLLKNIAEKFYFAYDGNQGLEYFKEIKPDIVITDIQLPLMNGLELLSEIKYLNPDVRTVIVTGYGYSDYLQKSIELGVDGFLLKPLNKEKFYETIVKIGKSITIEKELHTKTQKLTESEFFLKQVVDVSSEALRIIDKNRTIIRVNKTYLELHNMLEEDVVLKKCNDLFCTKFCNNEICSLDLVLNTQKKIETHIETDAFNNGNKHFIYTATPFTNANGECIGMLESFRDITNYKNIETSLKDSEERYKYLVETLDEGIASFDTKENFTYANPALKRIFSDNRFNLTGKNIYEFVSEETTSKIIEEIENRKKGIKGIYEIKIKTPSGYKYLQVTATPKMENREFVGSIAIFRDVTPLKNAEREILDNQQKLLSTINSIDDIVFVIDKQGIFKEVYAPREKIFSIPKQSFIGKSYSEIGLPHNVVEKYKNAFLYLEENSDVQEIEVSLKIENEIRWFSSKISRQLSQKQKLKRYVVVIRDITDRKKIDIELENYREHLELLIKQRTGELKASEEKYRMLAENIYDVIWKMDIETFKISYVSPSIKRLRGFTVDEVLNHNALSSVTPDFQDFIVKQLPARIRDFENGDESAKVWVNELTQPTKDNSIIWVEIVSTLLTNEKGKVTHVLGVSRDIQKRKNEELLRIESEEKYRTLFESAPYPVGITTFEGKVIDANNAFCNFFGYTKDELLISVNTKELYKTLKDREKLMDEIRRKHFVSSYEIDFVRRYGEVRNVSISVNIIEIGEEKVLLSIFDDITEKKNREKLILNTIIQTEERDKSNFAKELHDGLGPILSTTKLYLQTISETNDLYKVLQTAEMANKTIDDAIQTVTEISNNISPHVLKNFGLVSAIKSFNERFKFASKINIEFNCNFQDRLSEIVEITLYRVIIEMLNNTVKHAHAKNIKISLIKYHQKLALEFSDDGKGFDVLQVMEKKKGMGLFNIQSRLKHLKADMNIKSSPDGGTKINIILDIESAM